MLFDTQGSDEPGPSPLSYLAPASTWVTTRLGTVGPEKVQCEIDEIVGIARNRKTESQPQEFFIDVKARSAF